MRLVEDLIGKEFVAFECTLDADMRLKSSVPNDISAFLRFDSSVTLDGVSLWDMVFSDELEARRNVFFAQLDEGDVEVALPLVCGDGIARWFLCRGRRCENSVKGILVSIERIKVLFDKQSGKLSRYKERLEHTENIISTLQVLSEQDSLTKLYNADTTRRLCSNYYENADEKCAIIMIDLDDFKQVNDIYGHMQGDRVITRFSSEIRNLFRSADILGRVGGDEFLIMMKGISDSGIVNKKCAALVNAVFALAEEMKCPFLGCSVGAVVSDTGTIAYEELFRLVDSVMYGVKNKGGHNYVVTTI